MDECINSTPNTEDLVLPVDDVLVEEIIDFISSMTNPTTTCLHRQKNVPNVSGNHLYHSMKEKVKYLILLQ